MKRAIAILAAVVCLVFATADNAFAKHRPHVYHPKQHHRPIYAPATNNQVVGCDVRCPVLDMERASPGHGLSGIDSRRQYAYDDGRIVGSRPSGCPHRYCGCEASLYKFGRIIPSLNLAWNWVVKFPRTSAAPGMAAARKGHVMILIAHVEGLEWEVHDGNSGHGLTREHVRSIAGYVIVNPNMQLASQ